MLAVHLFIIEVLDFFIFTLVLLSSLHQLFNSIEVISRPFYSYTIIVLALVSSYRRCCSDTFGDSIDRVESQVSLCEFPLVYLIFFGGLIWVRAVFVGVNY